MHISPSATVALGESLQGSCQATPAPRQIEYRWIIRYEGHIIQGRAIPVGVYACPVPSREGVRGPEPVRPRQGHRRVAYQQAGSRAVRDVEVRPTFAPRRGTEIVQPGIEGGAWLTGSDTQPVVRRFRPGIGSEKLQPVGDPVVERDCSRDLFGLAIRVQGPYLVELRESSIQSGNGREYATLLRELPKNRPAELV